MLRKAALPAVASLVLLGALVLPTASAYAATVSRAELKGGQLRLDGVNAAPGIFVMVRSSSSLAGARVRRFRAPITYRRPTSARTTARWWSPTGLPPAPR